MIVELDTTIRKAELLKKAKELRDITIESDILVFDVLWQVNKNGRDNMRNAIETAVTLNLPADEMRGWILSDNSIRPTTADDLRQVLIAYTFRMDLIFQQYTTWRMNGASTIFTLNI
jgi:hypothetical protein